LGGLRDLRQPAFAEGDASRVRRTLAAGGEGGGAQDDGGKRVHADLGRAHGNQVGKLRKSGLSICDNLTPRAVDAPGLGRAVSAMRAS
jgi:hypothetical protein